MNDRLPPVFHAGYVLEAILEAVGDEGKASLRSLCSFHIDVSPTESPVDESLWAVADNIVSRGLPTFASPRIERKLAEVLGLTRELDARQTIAFRPASAWGTVEREWILRALAIVDPRVPERLSTAKPRLESEAEHALFDAALPRIVGSWTRQWVEPQRPVETLLNDEKGEFVNQRVDFAVEWPSGRTGQRDIPTGVVIEVDGMHHQNPGQLYLDKKRDAALRKAGWADTIRVRGRDASSPPMEIDKAISAAFDHPHGKRVAKNWAMPLWEDDAGRQWMQAVLVPLAVARVQKALIRCVLDGHLDPDAFRWRIAVVERDIPCARLAVDDLLELLRYLYDLEGRGRTLPAVELRVYRTAEFESCELADEAEQYGSDVLDFDADVLFDMSILQRAGFSRDDPLFCQRVAPHGVTVEIRSTYSDRGERRVTAAPAVVYVGTGSKGDPEPEALRYFLQLLFRKRAFREHQVDIIRPALEGTSVAGILPTGAGKSLCYQMAALLQPGVTLVVSPLKSLMRDQDANLRRARIDTTAFINSSLTATAMKLTLMALGRGTFQLAFVSPERFQIDTFRRALAELEAPVTYAVADEAHCVSEWGHDFRTAYLRLGQNVRKFCKTAWQKTEGQPQLPIIALTGAWACPAFVDTELSC